MENDLLRVLAALSEIDVHGEKSCKNIVFCIATIRSAILQIQAAAQKAKQETEQETQEMKTDGE